MNASTIDVLHTVESDVVVIGAGVAGLSCALGLSGLRVTLLSKRPLGTGGNSPWAQGGVAAAIGPDDSPALHEQDTIDAGAGLCARDVVRVLTSEAPAHIRRLIALGTRFDADASGALALGREAAHRRHRILHAHGDASGAEIVRALVEAVRAGRATRVDEAALVEDLILAEGRVAGVVATDRAGRRTAHLAPVVVLATGGSGRVFLHTTNPPEATGDGLAMAARAGAILADVEFVQFHPTALDVDADQRPLLTEALRGAGAVLVDERGDRFTFAAHPDGELAPRDVVSRAIWAHRAAGHLVFLDARHAVGAAFPRRFPTVFEACLTHGLDPRVSLLPVTPAAHYHMGGVATDARGRCSLLGLWACGEVASTGVHGANRLASNSLLEALVFGARVAEDIASGHAGASRAPRVSRRGFPVAADAAGTPAVNVVRRVQSLMWEHVGLVRTGPGLARAERELDDLAAAAGRGEPANIALVARAITAAAIERRESRGAHYRADHPSMDPACSHRSFIALRADGRFATAAWPAASRVAEAVAHAARGVA